jgi:hypothetical protein
MSLQYNSHNFQVIGKGAGEKGEAETGTCPYPEFLEQIKMKRRIKQMKV